MRPEAVHGIQLRRKVKCLISNRYKMRFTRMKEMQQATATRMERNRIRPKAWISFPGRSVRVEMPKVRKNPSRRPSCDGWAKG